MLHSMDDGETTMSAYDTAWVALVQDVNGSGRPQFPSCLEWIVNNQLPDGSWGEGLIFLAHDRIINTIPKSIMHKVPTTLLHSLEGVPNLEWEKLVKLQCKDGSFLFSPSSTAFALMQTKDEKCLQYLTNIVTKFNGGVPTAYPLDLFEHIWVVDRLQRLGISRYFKSEIEDCVQYIYRLLRMHGYEISPDVFQQFEKDGKFVCFVGQTTQATTGMFNLLRASQVLFPREKILDDAKKFSYNYLKEKQSTNELLDKWIIAKDLPGEVGYALDVPWMGNVSNNKYLEMAKLDYNNCLAMHQLEWNTMQQWYVDFNIGRFRVSNITSLLVSYYLAAASVFEPERSKERIAWAKTTTLVDAISSLFDSLQLSKEQRRDFVDEFRNTPSSLRPARWQRGDAMEGHALLIVQTVSLIDGRWTSKELLAHPQYQRLSSVTNNLCHEISQSHKSNENRKTCFENETTYRTQEFRMQELVQLVLGNSPDDLDRDLKQLFLTVAKTFFYKSYYDPVTINAHISKVLFETVI
ncbi:Terpene synthase, metal-binding domain-containing protein [Cynara cardunculus var. scolymus]|uniref:Terpene synthase, metal-binding domain-containing protein n=1 Tax=Cynara cardunculus var. scolymus TaxID=59895 RepID=A0A103XPE3_CYNCS|nr:Terpene synthase, metal-binding domain-containing protein [Cynara cardunculus var. scolymus]